MSVLYRWMRFAPRKPLNSKLVLIDFIAKERLSAVDNLSFDELTLICSSLDNLARLLEQLENGLGLHVGLS